MNGLLRSLLACAALVLLYSGISRGESNLVPTVIARLQPVLPVGWKVVARRSGVIPEGHYWGQSYSGVRGEEIVLQGPKDVHLEWHDALGAARLETLGKEALKIYVMPSNYRESLLRFFIPKRPVAARLVYEGPEYKIYAYPSFVMLMTRDAFDSILKQNTGTMGPVDSPEYTGFLTWSSWREDIRRALAVAS